MDRVTFQAILGEPTFYNVYLDGECLGTAQYIYEVSELVRQHETQSDTHECVICGQVAEGEYQGNSFVCHECLAEY